MSEPEVLWEGRIGTRRCRLYDNPVVFAGREPDGSWWPYQPTVQTSLAADLARELRDLREAARAYDQAAAVHDAANREWRIAADRYNRSEGEPAATDAVNKASDAEYEARKKREDARARLAALLPAPAPTHEAPIP